MTTEYADYFTPSWAPGSQGQLSWVHGGDGHIGTNLYSSAAPAQPQPQPQPQPWGGGGNGGGGGEGGSVEGALGGFRSIRDAFLAADVEGDGTVNREELITLLRYCNTPDFTVAGMLNMFDRDVDGEWSYREFIAAFKRQDYVTYARRTPRGSRDSTAPRGLQPEIEKPFVPSPLDYNMFTGRKHNQQHLPSAAPQPVWLLAAHHALVHKLTRIVKTCTLILVI
jgi:hypothetical protein